MVLMFVDYKDICLYCFCLCLCR